MRIDSPPTYRSLDLFLRGVTAGRCEYCGQGIRHGDGWVQRTGLDASAEAWNKTLVELFDCTDGYPMEGLWVQRLNERGLINDPTGYLRLYPAVTVLRNRMKELGEKIGVLVGHDYWELGHPAV